MLSRVGRQTRSVQDLRLLLQSKAGCCSRSMVVGTLKQKMPSEAEQRILAKNAAVTEMDDPAHSGLGGISAPERQMCDLWATCTRAESLLEAESAHLPTLPDH